MLSHLNIENIVLIDHLSTEMPTGVCALTGETGAGKSILLDALGLVLGHRAETRLIREGEEYAQVTAVFEPPKHSMSDLNTRLEESGHPALNGEDLIVRRRLSRDGRNKVYINDRPATQTLLDAIGNMLAEIHGQFDTHGLLNPKTHIDLLDRYGQLMKRRENIAELWQNFSRLIQEKTKLEADLARARQEEDYLRHAMDELDKLNPQEGEEDELVSKRKLYMNAEKLIEAVQTAQTAMSDPRGGGRDKLHTALAVLERQGDKGGDRMSQIIEGLNRASIEIDEALHSLDQLMSDLDLDPQEQNDIEERLFALRGIARKHNVSVAELPDLTADMRQRLELLDDQSDALRKVNKELQEAKELYLKEATTLHQERTEAAKNLEKAIMAELGPLKLEKAQFVVSLQEREQERWGPLGLSDIQFLISTNPGTQPGPLNKVASGGELARFMLAIKVVIHDDTGTPTLIFDEVDTGIGGATADAVGARLSQLGKNLQVLVVTHSPQVAAHADHQFRVTKISDGKTTKTQLKPLTADERVEEIARMLAGSDLTDEARSAARALLKGEQIKTAKSA